MMYYPVKSKKYLTYFYAKLLGACASLLVFCFLSTVVEARASLAKATDERALVPFSAIHSAGVYRLIVHQSNMSNVKISTEEGDNDFIKTEVRGRTLFVRDERKPSKKNKLKRYEIEVNTPQLEQLLLRGDFKVRLFKLQSDELNLHLNGYGVLAGVGEVKKLRINAQGSHQIRLHGLNASEVHLNTMGRSDISLRMPDTGVLHRQLIGQSRLTLYGRPQFGRVGDIGKVKIVMAKEKKKHRRVKKRH